MDLFGTKRREQEAEAAADENLRHLIAKAMQGDLEAGRELSSVGNNSRAQRLKIEKSLQVARELYSSNKNFAQFKSNLQFYFEEWQNRVKKGDLEAAAVSYSYFYRAVSKLNRENLPLLQSQLGIDLEGRQAQFVKAIQERYEQLLGPANQSHAGLAKLQTFIEKMNHYDYRVCDVNYPDNWNDLVVRLIPRPILTDFVGLKDYEKYRTYWLYLASDALASEDVPLAKQIIAVYTANDKKANAAFALKASELSDMIARKKARN